MGGRLEGMHPRAFPSFTAFGKDPSGSDLLTLILAFVGCVLDGLCAGLNSRTAGSELMKTIYQLK